MKKSFVLAAAALTLTAFIAGTTLSYFTDTDVATNTFTVGDLAIEEVETDWNNSEDGKDLYPGATRYKNPTVRNITDVEGGNEPGYVRMIVEVLDAQENAITNQEALDLIWTTIRYDADYNGTGTKKATRAKLEENHVPGYSLAELGGYDLYNKRDFTEASDYTGGNKRIFLYTANNGKLQAGEEATLFSTIVIPTDWTQTQIQKVGNYQLKVSAEAIQAKGFHTQAEAFRALDEEKAKAGNS
ncbi:MAG: SipW-dependent-type signal peptide-containing protein [Blautia sp.]|nr:SipW-dependent-type signal peptide-containing protein [Blautia sp.]